MQGIGLALTEKYAETGTHVIAVGRRKEHLDELAGRYEGKISTKVFDIAALDKISTFVKEVTSKHPDLDGVFLNSDIQRGFNFSNPEAVDLAEIDFEFTTNYLSNVHMTKYFLQFLLKKKSTIMYTTSGLALVPLPRCPNYCASKAALHHFILATRRQLEGSSVKVVELLPPAVQTELHDAKHQPGIKNGREIGITLDEFMTTAWAGIVEGKEEIPVGFVIRGLEKINGPRKAMMVDMPCDATEFGKISK